MPLSSIAAAAIASVVVAALDDLRQRRDRLRRAGAGVRLAELEQDRGAVAVAGGSSSARASSAAAPAASPRASASRAASRSSATASGSAAGSVCMTCAATWPGGRSALAQDLRRRAVQPLAFGRRQVAVDRRAQDRMGEADGAAGLDTPAETSAAIAASSSAPASPASRAASPICAPSPSTLSARASAPAGGAQPRQAEQHRVRDAARDDRAELGGAAAALGSMPRAADLVEQLAEQERVAAGHLDARVDEAIVAARRTDGPRSIRRLTRA